MAGKWFVSEAAVRLYAAVTAWLVFKFGGKRDKAGDKPEEGGTP